MGNFLGRRWLGVLPWVFGAFAAGSALASGQTPFDQISGYFAHARAVEFNKAEGIYAGRCFDREAPDQTLVMTLLIENKLIRSSAGPLFDEIKPVFTMVPYSLSTGEIDPVKLWDLVDTTSIAQLRSDLEAKIGSDWVVTQESPVIQATYKGVVKISVGTSQGYLMLSARSIMTADEIFVCYFEKKN
ncbi:MAG: hypothetical protein JNL01_08290 [Bdellovibrionales bacterium]|nr:hypothetical protein [Bdellovibrionales bacterium]